MWSNIHTHSRWCDGKSSPDELAARAEALGMVSLGFASHGPLPFPCKWCIQPGAFDDYLTEINQLKKTAGLPVYAGLEVDYIPGLIGPADLEHRLDFTIGSIHFVDGEGDYRWEADTNVTMFKEGLTRVFNGDVKKAVIRYFTLMREMLSTSTPDVLGHMDRIKMHNTQEFFFNESEKWYRNEVADTIDLAREKGVIIEVNTRGLYKKRSLESYPGQFGLSRIAELKIPVMLASDAHHQDDLILFFPEVATQLREAGIRNIVQLTASGWREVPLPALH